MKNDNLIELTNKLYKITLLFPKKEPLRYKMREVADDILANLVSWELFSNQNLAGFSAGENSLEYKKYKDKRGDLLFILEKDLEILKSYFEIAKWQNWVNYFDILNLEEEYDKIKDKISAPKPERTKTLFELDVKDKAIPLSSPAPLLTKSQDKNFKEQKEEVDKSKVLDFRKEKILKFLKEKGRVQVWEISKVLPEVSKRTLRRDFAYLLEIGLIERIGERNNTFYQLKK